MKKIYLFGLFTFLTLSLLPTIGLAESISSFKSDIQINSDSSINVKETIVYDFGDLQRHGIYRDIPYSYKARGGNYTLGINVKSVTDERGSAYDFQTRNSGNNLQIKIGDANVTITGVHTYVIKYEVSGAINYFTDHDELYWNVNGNDWQVAATEVDASVYLPQDFAGSGLDYICFAGPLGVNLPCSSAQFGSGNTLRFVQGNVGPGEGLTIAVSLPKGFVHEPSFWERASKSLKDNSVLFLPVAVFLLMWYLWHKKGRDPRGFSTIVPQYEAPEGLTPTEAGTILDENVDNKDIAAEIIHLAVRGYIKINKLDKKVLGLFSSTDYEFELLKDYSDLTVNYEKLLMDEFFALEKKKKLSALKNQFYVTLKSIREDVYQSVVLKGYFSSNPQKTKILYLSAGMCVAFVGIWMAAIMLSFFALLAFLSSGLIISIFGYFMPKPTLKGAKAKQEILGLKLYLSVAEKDRLNFFNAPEKTPERFEKLLPYAIALGVEVEWAKQFEGLYSNPPSWYSDPSYHGSFNSILFVSALNNFSYSANRTFASHPSSSGASGGSSGFSGGGFGGGGGGSW